MGAGRDIPAGVACGVEVGKGSSGIENVSEVC